MAHTLTEIRAFATRLGVHPAELLRLARESEQDANMPAIAHLSAHGREDLFHTLVGISYMRAVRSGRLALVK